MPPSLLALAPLPVWLALAAAALFGTQAVVARQAVQYVDAQTGAMTTIVVSSLAFWMLSIGSMRMEFWSSPALWVFAVNGLVHPALSMFLSFEANRRMGATLSATIAASTPLFATMGAVVGLGEGVSTAIILGTLGIVLGVVVLSWRTGAVAIGWPLWALVFPMGAAIVRAFNHVWGRFGLEMLHEPIFAATVSFTVSAATSVIVWSLRRKPGVSRLHPRGMLWATCSGLVVFLAISFMYTALNTGHVVVVSPVINTYPLFTLIVALLVGQERLSVKVLAGVVLVIGGVVLVSLH